MAKELSWWKWENEVLLRCSLVPIAKEDHANLYSDPLKVTMRMLDQLRVCKEKLVRTWIEQDRNITRLLEPLRFRNDQGDATIACIKVDRTQRKHAVAAHMMLEKINVRGCKNCKNPRNEGPFTECISFGPKVFNGACSCCQYSSSAHNCEFHKSNGGSKAAETRESEKQNQWPILSREMLKIATTRQLEQSINWMKAEIADRESISALPPSKRRRCR